MACNATSPWTLWPPRPLRSPPSHQVGQRGLMKMESYHAITMISSKSYNLSIVVRFCRSFSERLFKRQLLYVNSLSNNTIQIEISTATSLDSYFALKITNIYCTTLTFIYIQYLKFHYFNYFQMQSLWFRIQQSDSIGRYCQKPQPWRHFWSRRRSDLDHWWIWWYNNRD